MKCTKQTTAILAFCLLLALSGCGGAQSASVSDSELEASQTETAAGETSFTVTDMTGRDITLDGAATRVVALTASDCEILYAVGAGDTLVGRGEYCDYPDEVASIPTVQSGENTNIEQIIALKPEVVLMSSMAQTEEQVEALSNAGIQVVVSDATDIDGVYTAIELIGSVVGRGDQAEAVIQSMKQAFTDIEAKVPGDGSKTIYFEVSPLEYGLWTAGSGTFMDEMATMLGLKNAFADVEGWAEISQEQVIERNPDYIVTITIYDGQGDTPVEEIMGRQGWQSITAVQNGAVFNADSNEVSRPGPRLADAMESLYGFVYGDGSTGAETAAA